MSKGRRWVLRRRVRRRKMGRGWWGGRGFGGYREAQAWRKWRSRRQCPCVLLPSPATPWTRCHSQGLPASLLGSLPAETCQGNQQCAWKREHGSMGISATNVKGRHVSPGLSLEQRRAGCCSRESPGERERQAESRGRRERESRHVSPGLPLERQRC